jgi:hypothetical protein
VIPPFPSPARLGEGGVRRLTPGVRASKPQVCSQTVALFPNLSHLDPLFSTRSVALFQRNFVVVSPATSARNPLI